MMDYGEWYMYIYIVHVQMYIHVNDASSLLL